MSGMAYVVLPKTEKSESDSQHLTPNATGIGWSVECEPR